MSLTDDAESRIAQVRGDQSQALSELEAKWFGGEERDNAVNGIKSLDQRIAKWEADGRAAAAKNDAKFNWQKWIDAGNALGDGIRAQHDLGSNGRLANIHVTVKETADTAKAVAKKTAKVAQTVVKETAETTGSALGSVLGPIKPVLYVLAAAVGLGALAYLAMHVAPRSVA